jgi:hypothetical protein
MGVDGVERCSHGGGARLAEEEEQRDRVEPFLPTTYIKARVSGLISGPIGKSDREFLV